MVEPGRFRLREDGRSYRFYMTTKEPVRKLVISAGSTLGGYDFALRLFDEVLAEGRTVEEIRRLEYPSPARYKLGSKSFYTIILELGKDKNIKTELVPYHFEIALD